MLKRFVSIMVLILLLANSCVSALGYYFPEPDWGALYREKEAMVTESEFELYAEAALETAPYYGAKFEPRGGAYIGSIAENSQKLQPLGAYLTYIEDMYQDDFYYPANSMISSDNVIAMVGWTINDMSGVDYNQVRKVLDRLNSYNKPMFIRFANEMNCSALGDDPDKYIEVFRTVADMIHEYPNFAVVWSPVDIGSLDRPFGYYYPGEEYVDWIGVSCYAIRYFMGNKNAEANSQVYFMTEDYAWHTNRIKPIMEFLEENNINKPVMISEGGVPTSNNYGEDLQSWASPRLRNMLWYTVMKYPQIKMINYFYVYRANENQKFNITDYPYAVDIFNEAKNSGAYITEYGKDAEFTFSPANSAGILNGEDGSVPLYTLAYFAHYPDITVNYYLDDNWYHSSNQIPYKCNLYMSDISDGMHTLKIATLDREQTYTFYKSGNKISFGSEISIEEEPQTEEYEISVTVNGERVTFDQPPVLQNDRTLVPLRAIFEALGAEVDWNDETKTVTSVKNGINVKLSIGSNILYVNGTQRELDVPAQLMNGRTMVPVRAVSEAFGCDVKWDDDSHTVIINQ